MALEPTDPHDHTRLMELYIAAKNHLHQPSIRLHGVVINSVHWQLFICVRTVCRKSYYLQARPSVYVRPPACFRAAPTGRISVKLDNGWFYENLSRKSKFG